MNPFGIISAIFGDKGIVGSVVDILKSTGVMKDPDQELKVTQALMAYEIAARDQENKFVETVNATMREEAKSEHFLQWSWRPMVGYTFIGTVVNNYVFLPYFAKFGLLPVDIPGEIWSAMLVVLGVAAGTRGLVQWQAQKNGSSIKVGG